MDMCVHAFRSVVTFGRTGLSAEICCVTRYSVHYLQSETFSVNVRNGDQVGRCRLEVSFSLSVCDNDSSNN